MGLEVTKDINSSLSALSLTLDGGQALEIRGQHFRGNAKYLVDSAAATGRSPIPGLR